MTIDIEKDYEKDVKINYKEIITSVIREAVDYIGCPYECEVCVTITGNEAIREINQRQRGIDSATDVLSFPMLEYDRPADFSKMENTPVCFHPDTGELLLGDIVISYDRVISQAAEYNHSEKRELAFLTAHSMLHLFGFDHIEEGERRSMEEKQEQILINLGITRE